MQLLVVRPMRELVEAPQLLPPLIVRPELLDLTDEIPHANAEPWPRAVLPEQPVELRHSLLAEIEINRVTQTGPAFENAVPKHAAVLMMLLDPLDGLVTVQRDPVCCGHVLEERAVQHVGLLAVAAPTQLHDRAIRQCRPSEDRTQ